MSTQGNRFIRTLLLPLALAALVLAGCSTTADTADSNSELPQVSVSDAWVRATDGPMTGAFGVLQNNTDEDVTVVSATNSASAKTELHEVVLIDGESTMQAKEGGFTIEAGQSMALEPGANHVMIMMLKEPIKSGDAVSLTLELADGSQISYDAQAKEASAGAEPYHDSNSDMKDSGSQDSMKME